jgi:hypothetical protein
VRPGFDSLREDLDQKLLLQTRATLSDRQRTILLHKIDSLLSECAAGLDVALKSAETEDSERGDLRRRILGEKEPLGQKETLDDTRLALRLIARHAAANTRSAFEALLRDDELPIRRRLEATLDREFPAWTRSLNTATTNFEAWLQTALPQEMTQLSKKHHTGFLEPLRRVNRQLMQFLQDFRNRISDRTMEALGVALRTTEMELRVEEPKSPDIWVGKIFDHSWEPLSWLIPMALIGSMVREHFHQKVERLVFANLSRLASQWEGAVNLAIAASEKEAIRRLDLLITNIEKLTVAHEQQTSQIRADAARIQELRLLLTPGREQ